MSQCEGNCGKSMECPPPRYKPGVRNLDRSDKPSLTHEWIAQIGMAAGEEALFDLKKRCQQNYDHAVNCAEQRLAIEQLAEIDAALKNPYLPRLNLMEEFLQEADIVASEPLSAYGAPLNTHTRRRFE